MSNIFNDLNKLVNTVQKVDKLLTEKPKKTTPTKSIPLTNEERKYINKILCSMEFRTSPSEEPLRQTLLNKIK